MDLSFLVKIFDAEFSLNLYVLRSLESEKVVFGNWSVRMWVCASDCVRIIQRFIFPKLVDKYTQNFMHNTR